MGKRWNNIEINYLKDNYHLSIPIDIANKSELIKSNCYYCDGIGDSKFGDYNYNNEILTYTGIDRKDNNKGYIIDNCVSCCKRCNFMKHTLTKFEFIEHINKIYEYQKSKS